MRIVFMGTPAFAVPTLVRLVDSEHQVVAVYTQPDRPLGRGRHLSSSPVKSLALRHGLEVIQPISLRSSEVQAHLQSLHPDLIIVAAYGLILPKKVLAIPPEGCLNLHASLLPRHRGPSPIVAAILAGDEVTGVTLMFMDAGMDTGPILVQRQTLIYPRDTTLSLTSRLAQLGAQLLMEALLKWLAHDLIPKPQNEAEATYSRLLTKEDGEMDWRMPIQELRRKVRAFQPWPGCYTHWQGKILKILEAIPISARPDLEPGHVMQLVPPVREEDVEIEVGVQTADGVLGLIRVQLEGGRPLTAAEFVRGHRGFVGAVLPKS
ncbi:MAG: methionyl-tRNA formyltransferase [Chloroflexi bacterium]|nr:methionyl-tRNA formyltransferase [Chloroflexota bacterium]